MESLFSDTEIHYTVLVENQICGFVSITKLDKEVQELGLEFFEEYRHKGIGYAALVQFLEICKKEHKIMNIQSKVYADNFPSILLMRKIGGTPYGIMQNVCIEEASQLEYQELIFKIRIEPVGSQFNVSFTGNLILAF